MTAEAKTRLRSLRRLAARQVETLGPGFHTDGGGLNLRVDDKGNRNWEFRYTSPLTRKRDYMGFGSAAKGYTSLSTARELADQARALLARGLDPKVERDRQREEVAAAERRVAPKTFGVFAEEWMAANVGQHKNPKHRAQWLSTVRTHAAPIWDHVVADITTDDILRLLRPIWNITPETAKRTQGRIEKLLNAARAAGLRSGDNPAAWRGHLDTLLAKRSKPKHQPALPYTSAPQVAAALRARTGVAARALEFLILTAARSGEVRGMRWGELDISKAVWTVPAARMKAGNAHRVPLSARALALVGEMGALRPAKQSRDDLVFPGAQGAVMSDMTLAAVLKRMRRDKELAELLRDAEGHDVVVHGFRSTLRDWAEDVAHFPARVVEAALAHTIKDKSEAAYRRGDAFDVRVNLMDMWANYLMPPAASNVVTLPGANERVTTMAG